VSISTQLVVIKYYYPLLLKVIRHDETPNQLLNKEKTKDSGSTTKTCNVLVLQIVLLTVLLKLNMTHGSMK